MEPQKAPVAKCRLIAGAKVVIADDDGRLRASDHHPPDARRQHHPQSLPIQSSHNNGWPNHWEANNAFASHSTGYYLAEQIIFQLGCGLKISQIFSAGRKQSGPSMDRWIEDSLKGIWPGETTPISELSVEAKQLLDEQTTTSCRASERDTTLSAGSRQRSTVVKPSSDELRVAIIPPEIGEERKGVALG